MTRLFPISSIPALRPKVILLEDHQDIANGMCMELISKGMVCHSTGTLGRFVDTLKKEDYDVASVDWDINGIHEGPTALARLRQLEADAAKVVYSVFVNEKITRVARSKGADYVLEKRVGQTEQEYVQTIQKAARLGLARRIAACLAVSGLWSKDITAPESPESPVDESIELELYTQARKTAYESALAGDENDELLELIKRRGWWQEFDRSRYAALPLRGKLAELTRHANATTEDIAQILKIEPAIAHSLLDPDYQLMIESIGLLENIDKLLSVFAYALRLSQYEPELMAYYWHAQSLFANSTDSPPWDADGLSAYLKFSGITGIRNALFWIRSH